MDNPQTPFHTDQEPVQGLIVDLTHEADRAAVLEQAFNYRGDITLYTTDGNTLEGYLFDRCPEGPEPFIRLIVKDTTRRVRLPYAQIQRLAFTGRNTAAGKSWETWVRHYLDKKARGEKAIIEAEPLE